MVEIYLMIQLNMNTCMSTRPVRGLLLTYRAHRDHSFARWLCLILNAHRKTPTDSNNNRPRAARLCCRSGLFVLCVFVADVVCVVHLPTR